MFKVDGQLAGAPGHAIAGTPYIEVAIQNKGYKWGVVVTGDTSQNTNRGIGATPMPEKPKLGEPFHKRRQFVYRFYILQGTLLNVAIHIMGVVIDTLMGKDGFQEIFVELCTGREVQRRPGRQGIYFIQISTAYIYRPHILCTQVAIQFISEKPGNLPPIYIEV